MVQVGNALNYPTEEESVNDRLPFPVGSRAHGELVQISRANTPIPVTMSDFIWRATVDGRIFISSDADFNDAVTGQTTLANTTPTFLLRVPAGTLAVPLFGNFVQTGTVAGSDIDFIVEIDNVDRWSSAGTIELAYNPSLTNRVNSCELRSGATAAAGYGITVVRYDIAADVSPAEGAIQGPLWKPEIPYLLEGPASLLIYTNATTTGPTWWWSIGWAEYPTVDFFRLWPRN
mgnify:CR=1 FL=1